MDTISVIIPTYNRAGLIRRSVESVLTQTWQALEVIVVDDGSTDDTEQVVAAIADPRVRYHRMAQNGGACAARNMGVSLAQGEYIAFQDSDDAWLPHKLATQMQQLTESGADVVFCSFERYRTDGTLAQVFPDGENDLGRITYQQLLHGSLVSTQTLLGKRVCFEQLPFNPAMPRLQDWELMLRMVQRYDVRHFATPLVRMYEQADSISGNPQKLLAALAILVRQHGAAINRDAQAARHFRRIRTIGFIRCVLMRIFGQKVWQKYLRGLSPRNIRAALRRLAGKDC